MHGAIRLLAVLGVFVYCAHPSGAQGTDTRPDVSVRDPDADGLEDALEATLGTSSQSPDSDGDGLSDYDEHCKYRTDPTRDDSDGDGKPDGDWGERREYTYTIRAVCEIRPPARPDLIEDLYQDARPTSLPAALEDAAVVEVLLFPFSKPHIYAQPYPRKSIPQGLNEYVQPTASMNYSREMKQEVAHLVGEAATDVEAVSRVLRWIGAQTRLVRHDPHWEFLQVVDNRIVWHRSLGSPEQDQHFLETNFLADSMFKNRVHGTCSSLAILRGAMLRAAGLPTRIIQTLPLITRYTEDPEPLAERLRMRSMAKGYDWGPGRGGANHTYNEVYLNNRWIRVDDSIGTGPFVGGKLFVKAYSIPSWSNHREEWNEKRCFRALDVSDAYAVYGSGSALPDMAVEEAGLTVRRRPDGRAEARILIRNEGYGPCPQFRVDFYAGKSKASGRLLSRHSAGPIMPGGRWGELAPDLKLLPEECVVTVVIDRDNEVDEADETNNETSRRVPGTSGDGPRRSTATQPELE